MVKKKKKKIFCNDLLPGTVQKPSKDLNKYFSLIF